MQKNLEGTFKIETEICLPSCTVDLPKNAKNTKVCNHNFN